jgi:hypothetical protein
MRDLVTVERRVPSLPFSREIKRLERLKRSLTVYRLAFGQPRQDDLLDYLQTQFETIMTPDDIVDLQICLEPNTLIGKRSSELMRSKDLRSVDAVSPSYSWNAIEP